MANINLVLCNTVTQCLTEILPDVIFTFDDKYHDIRHFFDKSLVAQFLVSCGFFKEKTCEMEYLPTYVFMISLFRIEITVTQKCDQSIQKFRALRLPILFSSGEKQLRMKLWGLLYW